MSRAVAAAVAVLLALAGTAAADVSPGPLAKGHRSLEGDDKCTSCHSTGEAISASKCLSCHKALDLRIAAKAGYHAKAGSDCATCHPDHRGVDAELIRWPKGGRDKFDHAGLANYKLDGGHSGVDCRKCHAPAFLAGTVAPALTADERPRTYLGLSTACATCHADPHKPSLGTNCASCHDTAGWRGGKATSGFDHGKTRYPLLGAHAKVDCTKCHGGTTQKLADLHPKFDTCATCHQDPHAGTMGTAPTACATCHSEKAWTDLRYQKKTHAPKTLPLTKSHAAPKCADCHGPKLDKKITPACVGCHADPHKPSLGTTCQQCHGTSQWLAGASQAAAKTAFHDKTAYPLRGLHTTVACAQCHDPKKPAAKRYRPIAHGRCDDCHKDPHLGEASRACDGCHAVDGWKAVRFEAADHAKTKFALEGAHRAVPCSKCHPSAPKSPGFKQGAPACEACHADPHAGQFAGKGTCATCHAVAGWSPSTFTKQAHDRAGFALAGKHDVACGRCHAGAAGAATGAKFVGLATDCGACHEDRHVGQLAGRACTTCHAGAEWKPTPGFDHAAAFPLEGRHAAVDCARCHPTLALHPTPATTIRTEVYKLGTGARECVGCHKAQHGDPNSGLALPRKLAAGTRACKDCHDEIRWGDLTTGVAFDHAATGAPLVGGHASAACASCHKPAQGPVAPLAECTSCHQDRHAGRMGDRCEACHSASSWKQDQLLVDHRRTRLPLVGAHAVQGCTTCHQDASTGNYRGLDPACRSCHFDTVAERRPHPNHDGPAFLPCENCHSALGWRPAQLDHDRYWPLTGAHQSTACARCHKPGEQYGDAPTRCIGCHQDDLVTGNMQIDHSGFGDECQQCHNTTTWAGATFDHSQFFPLRGAHDVPCASCHTTPGMNQAFSCISGGCHPRSQTDGHHDDVGGYVYDSQQCYRCHRNGRGGD